MLTDERMHQLCENWREALNLKDWAVNLQIVGHGILRVGAMGDCNMVVNKKYATIRLLSAQLYPAMRAAGARLEADDEFEQERCLVHELMHLHYAPLDSMIGNDSVAEVILEQAISSVDRVIVELAQAARGSAIMAAAA